MKAEPKSAKVAIVRTPGRSAPPVYQPCPAREVVQARMMVGNVRLQTAKLMPPPVYKPAHTLVAQPKAERVTSSVSLVPTGLTLRSGTIIQATKAGKALLDTDKDPPTTSSGKWAQGILFFMGGRNGQQLQQIEFGANSGTYAGTEKACKGKDGYRNSRAGKGDNINHSCGEAHVLNWADSNISEDQTSRLMLLTQETMCAQCEIDLAEFSTDHPNCYIQVRSKSLYGGRSGARLRNMNSNTDLFEDKDKKGKTFKIYRPMVAGSYIGKNQMTNQIRALKLGS